MGIGCRSFLPETSSCWFSSLPSLLASLSPLGAPAHGYGHAPELLCRDTNTSIYAEVCVPAFAEQATPVTLAVKEVVDDDYCFDRVLTICEETNTVVQREVCTYVYEREDVTAPCTTTQVTYEENSETMKVTTCGVKAPAYGDTDTQLLPMDMESSSSAMRNTRPRFTRSHWSPLLWRCLAVLLTPLPRRSVSPRTSPSLRSSARTKLRTSASMWPSLLMPPTLLNRRRSSLESQAVSRSPSLWTLRLVSNNMWLMWLTPSLWWLITLHTMLCTMPSPLSTMDKCAPSTCKKFYLFSYLLIK